MADLHFDNIGIAALTCAVPSFVQPICADPDNPASAYLKTFLKQTGVRQRHISITEQTCTDLGHAALRKALSKADWPVESLDGLVFMSQTPDYNPGTGNAFVLHYRMGMSKDALAFDITLGCSSFPFGLAVCASLLQQEKIQRIAMVSGDTMWPNYTSPDDLLASENFIVGEGTTAILLEKRPDSPVDIALHSDGSGYHYLFNPFGGMKNAWRSRANVVLPNGEKYTGGGYMDGLEITSFATTTVVKSIQDFLQQRERSLDDYTGLVLHQANMQIISTMAKRLRIDRSRVPVSVDRYANTNNASVTLTMADAYAGCECDRLSLLCCAFGIGLSWGIVDLSLDSSVIEPIFTSDERWEEGFVTYAE